jgi:signal peptidase II
MSEPADSLPQPPPTGLEPGRLAPAVATMPSSGPQVPATPAARDQIDLESKRPSYVFFGVVSAISLLADVGTKAWAEIALSKRTLLDPSIVIVQDHLWFTLAYNKGGAWGLLQNASESVRRPFFLVVSVLAIAFIVSLYGRLVPGQRALTWGLPLVLGGALGNLSDRITRSSVIDFIDYRAGWIGKMNELIASGATSWSVTDHWPTFNVADISICIGVGLMAVDMITSRKRPPEPPPAIGQGDAAATPVASPGTETPAPPAPPSTWGGS